MAIFRIDIENNNFYVKRREDFITECSSSISYDIFASEGDTIDISLDGSHKLESYTLAGVKLSFDNEINSIVFNSSLSLSFVIVNSGIAGIFNQTIVTVTNGTTNGVYNDVAIRLNDSDPCDNTDSGGALTYDALLDTPPTKLGSEGKYVRVNMAGTLHEYVDLPQVVIPPLIVGTTFVVDSETEMIGLTDAITGDIAVRTDILKSFILRGTDPTILGDWQELLTPLNRVISVNNLIGDVSLNLGLTDGFLSITGGNFINLDTRYQQLLIPGNNIGIVGNTISATDTTYLTNTLLQLNNATDTVGKLQTSKNLNDWLTSKGYITGFTVTENDVRQYETLFQIDASQVANLNYFSGNYNDLTNLPEPTPNIVLSVNGKIGHVKLFEDNITGKVQTIATASNIITVDYNNISHLNLVQSGVVSLNVVPPVVPMGESVSRIMYLKPNGFDLYLPTAFTNRVSGIEYLDINKENWIVTRYSMTPNGLIEFSNLTVFPFDGTVPGNGGGGNDCGGCDIDGGNAYGNATPGLDPGIDGGVSDTQFANSLFGGDAFTTFESGTDGGNSTAEY